MNKDFKRGDKITCNNSMWSGQIGRIIENKGDICFCAFGDFEVHIETGLLKKFHDEFIKGD